MLTNGARIPVSFAVVFPHGCLLVPGSVGMVQIYDEATKLRSPQVDKVTGEAVWSARVIDLDPELGTRPRETVVKILAAVQPVPPSAEICPVEFDALTVTPYVNDKNRIAFSLRAAGMRAPAVGAKPRATRSADGDGKAA